MKVRIFLWVALLSYTVLPLSLWMEGLAVAIPVQIQIISPRASLGIGFEQESLKVWVRVSDANETPITGVQVEAAVILPDGNLFVEDSLPEMDEKGDYSNGLGVLDQDSLFGRYTLVVTVSGAYQGEQTCSFEVFNRLKVLERYDFCVKAPKNFAIGSRGKTYARLQGDVSLELSSYGSNSVLIYRKTGQVLLELEPVAQLLAEINWGSYEMDTIIEGFEFIEFDGRPALNLTGHWTQETFGQGPLMAIGLQCDDYFFIIQAANNGPLFPDLLHVMNSFHYLGE